MEGSSAPLLAIYRISLRFGGIIALDGVSFDVERGKIVGLIGPNGAGKTTLFNCLTRLYDVDAGNIEFQGRSILKTPPHRIAHLGIARTFQNLALFSKLSVFDNVMIGMHSCTRSDFLSNALRLPWVRREEREIREATAELVHYFGLEALRDQRVEDLPFGTMKRVELARALASRPKILLLDEPASGLNHEEVEELIGMIREIREQRNVTILLVEHHMNLVMRVSDKVVAIDFGRKIAEGPPQAVQADEALIQAYLGGGAA